jgi:molybdopterin/thiamine biosynthesis adenylyltransferase
VNTLAISSADFDQLHDGLLSAADGRESCALILGTTGTTENSTRYVVSRVHIPSEAGYRVRSPERVELNPEFFVPLIRAWRGPDRFVGFAHTHPFSDWPAFSHYDFESELNLRRFLSSQFPNGNHASLVFGQRGCLARELGTDRSLRVVAVGRSVSEKTQTSHDQFSAAFDRQIRALGDEGQSALRSLKVGIVGLGGTGSATANLLGHLGIERFGLVDFDVVDQTNLNRLIGATAEDIGVAKVRVVAAVLRAINPNCAIELISGDVGNDTVARRLIDYDLVFSCTDSHGSRTVLNQLAYQYLVPVIDMGVAVAAAAGRVTHIAGRIQLLASGLGCLTCGSLLDPDEVRRDLLTDAQRKHDPYIVGARVPQPAVASINGTAASLAVTMFLAVAAGLPVGPRLQLYDGLRGTVRPAEIEPVENCVVCSTRGAHKRGDTWPLPTRKITQPPNAAHSA